MPRRASIQEVSGGSGAACHVEHLYMDYQLTQALHAESSASTVVFFFVTSGSYFFIKVDIRVEMKIYVFQFFPFLYFQKIICESKHMWTFH